MNKITHNGKQYIIDGLYEFSDMREAWCIQRLRGISETSTAPFIDDKGADWLFIRELQNPIIGTIEDAPIELEDGCAYQFVLEGSRSIGFYESKSKVFDCPQGWVSTEKCEDIVKLVPEEK